MGNKIGAEARYQFQRLSMLDRLVVAIQETAPAIGETVRLMEAAETMLHMLRKAGADPDKIHAARQSLKRASGWTPGSHIPREER